MALRCGDGKLLAIHMSTPDKFWQNALQALENALPRARRGLARHGDLRGSQAIADRSVRLVWTMVRGERNAGPIGPGPFGP